MTIDWNDAITNICMTVIFIVGILCIWRRR